MRRFENVQALVVDDEEQERAALRAALEAMSITVSEAVDGADAIYQSLMTPFDLIILDIHLPNVDGQEAVRALRTVDPTCRIIVTGTEVRDQERRTLEAFGDFHFLGKPFQSEELSAAVEETLARPAVAEPVMIELIRRPGPA